MAARLLNVSRMALQQFSILAKVASEDSILYKTAILRCCQGINNKCFLQSVRQITFINTQTSGSIWKSVTGVSNVGKKRGRARGSRRFVDLNKNRRLGEGQKGMQWPGLNAPIISRREGRVANKIQVLPPNPQKQEELIKLREQSMKKRARNKIPPLQRGWTGNKLPGTSIGYPDPVEDYTFEGFDTRVLEFKRVATMTGTLGRISRFSAFVVTGNGNGLAGYAIGKAPNGRSALRKAMNRAAQHLIYVDRYENRTVFHNFYIAFHKTRLFVEKKEQGYGLVCHRALKTICQKIGIQDLYCKVEGSSKNIQALTKAFFEGLQRQETHQELADRLSLHVIEYRPEMDNIPRVVATPMSNVREKREEGEEEVDFETLYYDGRLPLKKPKQKPFYFNYQSFRRKLKQDYRYRNQPDALQLRIVHGLQPDYEVNRPKPKPKMKQ
ncbi:hypothetical protein CHS0354_032911 [Potamilus streckersoni]|uniref:Small ribosomal subunit protein uS5m n=1 Tax=Potamilus streckersoni TaxID=2493646 RepID=A0AAE0RWC6_9BIVA|nr:hypothetical protein CHS0354_032911 [Potamilus streckersoni]